MINITGTDIEINKGNAAIFTITLNGEDAPGNGTEVLFVVRKSRNNVSNLICKHLYPDNGVLTVEILPEDLKDICVGHYCWNLIIQFNSGERPWTVSKNAMKFTVLPEIGWW